MIVEVAFLAQDLQPRAEGKTVVLVDVLRATTTLATMFERGASRVMLAQTVDQARELKQECGGPCLLVGETGGLPPADFDYGNSPLEMKEADFTGKAIAFSSSNGAKAMARVSRAARILMGSYANASAVVREALADARQNGRDIAFVASGRAKGTQYGLDDCVCCGFLVDQLLKLVAAEAGVDRDPLEHAMDCTKQDPHPFVADFYLDDSAFIALRLARSYGGDALKSFSEGRDAQELTNKLGLGRDLPYCAQLDSSKAVPELLLQPDGKMVLVSRSLATA